MADASLRPAAEDLLRWYDRHRRTMPWRAAPGESADPYHVWLSEIMLQQTTVATVGPYFRRFVQLFPTVRDLAEAPVEAVMQAWAGLGYYARARNLHACAGAVARAGAFPGDVAGLQALPGIGAYTAAAIASIAFGRPVIPVDGNVERVAARVFGVGAALPSGRPAVAAAAARLGEDSTARARPGDFTQALFDLGATICTPRNPACVLCPWQAACVARRDGTPERFPNKPARKARPVRHGAAFWLEDRRGRVLLQRRPPQGLLGGLLGLPGTEWRPEPWTEPDAIGAAPQPAGWSCLGRARHGFTHFELLLDVYAARVPSIRVVGVLQPVRTLAEAGLPTAMRRCADVVAAASFGQKAMASPCIKVSRE